MKFIIMVCCFTLLNWGNILPQQSSDWPPDPTALFTDAVTVVKSEAEMRPGLLVEKLNRRIILGDGRQALWPDAIEDIWSAYKIIGDVLYLGVSSQDGEDSLWQLNLRTGQYTPLRDPMIYTQCGKINIEDPMPAYPWVMQIRNKQWQFCKVTTGWLSVPLPALRIWEIGDDPMNDRADGPTASPDGKWVVIFGYKTGLDMAPSAYAFELYTGQLNTLGFFEGWSDRDYEYYGAYWLDNQTAILSAGGHREWSTHDLYVADVTHPNSMRLVVFGPRFGARLLDNPPRYETFITPSATGTVMENCIRMIFDKVTHIATTYKYPGTMCSTEFGPFDGDGYYRDLSPDMHNAKVATLVRYNPVTGHRVELYRGEIEHILWVSADERYAALVMGENGRIGNIPGEEAYPGMELYNPKNSYMTILELREGKVLYRTPANILSEGWNHILPRRKRAYSSAVFADTAGYFWFPYVEQVSNNSLLLIDQSSSGTDSPPIETFSLLRIEGETVTVNDIPVSGDIAFVKPGDGRLLIWTGSEGQSALNLYDPGTGKVTLLIKADDRYSVFLVKADSGILTIAITRRGQDQDHFQQKMIYKLRLPD